MIITGKKFSKPEMSRIINGDKSLPSVPEKEKTTRLDHYLVKEYHAYNRSTIQKFIKSGLAQVNGKEIKKPNYQITAEDQITFTPPPTPRPTPPKPDIIYEDNNVLVINKPIGLLSMSKGAYNPEPTLEDYGLLVHRLDRDTSGVVILAKNEKTQSFLRKQFQDRKTHKTYNAVVAGHPKNPSALIDLPIARNYKHPTTFLVEAGGKPSETYYNTLAASNNFTLLELKPTTGRTHQLRVHLKYLGTPILGDRVYGDPKVNKILPHKSKEDPEPRLYLHAKELEITIPGPTPDAPGQRKIFTTPTPPEFTKILELDTNQSASPNAPFATPSPAPHNPNNPSTKEAKNVL